MEILAGVRVELAMGDAGAGAHELDLAWEQGSAIAHAVLVGHGAGEDIAEDFHVPVGVGAEAHACGDMVFIDDPQGAEVHMSGVVIVRKGEAVLGFEPAVVGGTPGGGGTLDYGIEGRGVGDHSK